jgi:hypothetical protein
MDPRRRQVDMIFDQSLTHKKHYYNTTLLNDKLVASFYRFNVVFKLVS